MHTRSIGVALLAAVIVASSALPSWGRPHDRSGFFIGFGLGVGNASWTWGFEAEDEPSEFSGVAQLRLGGALREDFVLGFEASTWVKEYDLESGGLDVGDAKTSFGLATLTATWFPGNLGVFIKGGLGIATVRGEVDFDLPGVEFLGIDETDRGLGALAATGYEWRLTQKFAVGPEVEVFYLDVNGDVADTVFVVDGAVEFNWYW